VETVCRKGPVASAAARSAEQRKSPGAGNQLDQGSRSDSIPGEGLRTRSGGDDVRDTRECCDQSLDCSRLSPPSRVNHAARGRVALTLASRCCRGYQRLVRLIPTTRKLAPTPCRLCEGGLSCRFLGRHGSILTTARCVEAVLHPVLGLWVFHASVTQRRRKDFPPEAFQDATLPVPLRQLVTTVSQGAHVGALLCAAS
jgi:hypothetical protein